jgi:hypothetical protein
VDYSITDYPVTLDVLERSLALDVRFLNPLCTMETQIKLLDGFRKVWEHLDEVAEYAESVDYVHPWEELSKLPPQQQIVEGTLKTSPTTADCGVCIR